MASTPKRRSLLGTTALAGFDPIIVAFIDDLRVREGIVGREASRHRGTARHFLAWLGLSGIALETVDCTVIERFLQHDCECGTRVPAYSLPRPWSKRRSWPPLMAFVRFLERTGRTETPGELDENLQLLDAFLGRMRADGYPSGTVNAHRHACANLIAWLHFARVRLCDLDPDAIARFRNREFICSIPGVFYGQRTRIPGGYYEREIRKFLGYLVAIGRIAPLSSAPNEVPSGILERFSLWLERHRGVGPRTIEKHVRLIAAVLPSLGDDPEAYDAALIRRVLAEQIEHCSINGAKKLATAMRMYLRFLASEGSVTAALVEALPTVPEWRLSALPKHILFAATEKCG